MFGHNNREAELLALPAVLLFELYGVVFTANHCGIECTTHLHNASSPFERSMFITDSGTLPEQILMDHMAGS